MIADVLVALGVAYLLLRLLVEAFGCELGLYDCWPDDDEDSR